MVPQVFPYRIPGGPLSCKGRQTPSLEGPTPSRVETVPLHFQAHDLNFPSHCHTACQRAGDVPVFLLHGHFVVSICEIESRPYLLCALPLQNGTYQGQSNAVLQCGYILWSQILKQGYSPGRFLVTRNEGVFHAPGPFCSVLPLN